MVVFPSLVVDVLVFVLDLDREYLHSVDELLGIGRVVFREVHVDEAGESVPVCTHPDDSVLVCVPVDDLLLESASFVPGAGVAAVLGVNGVAVEDPLSLCRVELLDCCLLLLLDACLVLSLKLPYFCVVTLLKLQVFLHDAVHVAVVYINNHHFLAFLQGLILVLQSELLGELLLKPGPLIIVIKLGPPPVVDGSLMSLVMFRLISADVRVEVESLLVVSVDDASDRVFGIGPSVRLESGFVKVVLVLGVGEGPGVGFKFFDILLHLFPPFFLLFCLFFQLSLADPLPNMLVLIVAFAPLVGCAG